MLQKVLVFVFLDSCSLNFEFLTYPPHPTSHFGAQEMQAVPTNMSAMSTIRMLRANTGGDNAQPPLPPEPSYALGIGGVDGVNRKVWIEASLR